jgi:TetR/AcrR family transcriptional regulator, transcriptional repressor of bet genes
VPAPTDHTVRRLEVARAAVHSIARTGLEGATLRAVADEGGWSVGVVQYYFRNKSELLIAAVEFLAEETSNAMTNRVDSEDVMSSLRNVLRHIIFRRGRQGSNYWKVWICFRAQATNDPLLAKAVEDHARQWRHRMAAVIQEGQRDGSINVDIDAENEAAYLAAVIDGLGLTSVVDQTSSIEGDMIERMTARLST